MIISVFHLLSSLEVRLLKLGASFFSWDTYHSSSGVDHFHLFEDRGAVICDQYFAFWCLDLFVSRGKKRSASPV